MQFESSFLVLLNINIFNIILLKEAHRLLKLGPTKDLFFR